MSLQSARGIHDEGYFQDMLVAVGLAKSCTPRKTGAGSPMRGLRRIKTSGPQTHKLPFGVMWTITLITAVTMAVINFFTIWIISFAVEWKFNTLQAMVDNLGVWFAIVGFTGICSCLALCCTLFIHTCAPAAGGSGAPENKGFLNGNEMPELFTLQNLVGRAIATMLANVTGYPVGREGPTVTMGSNLAYLITSGMALPFVRQWVDVDAPGSATSAATMIDEDRFEHAKRIVCTVGGACGMAMLFDSPIGGIVYMFEEITSSSWPVEVTFRAFAGTCVCALLSRALLNMCGTSTKAFVVYEWNPQPQGWSWRDVPFFILLAVLIGPFSAFHTRACLAVASARQKLMSRLAAYNPYSKMADAVLYGGLVALTYSLVALSANCKHTAQDAAEFVRYDCEEGKYNPVASLLLTTSEGAVKRLFSRHDANEIHFRNELLAFVSYTSLNIGLTGVPVPSGNFTGSMLIGGLIGRMMGALVRDYGKPGMAVSGVYAMVGSASMLAGFKQMAVAVVVFITGAANDLGLIPPLMLAVTIALLLNKLINERGFDEEQILRKAIAYLPAEPPRLLDRTVALELCDDLPSEAVLAPEVDFRAIKAALEQDKVDCFPVLKEGGHCIGFTTRARLQAAMEVWEASGFIDSSDRGAALKEAVSDAGGEQMGKLVSAAVARESSFTGNVLPVKRLTERAPYTILEDMPGPRLYTLFAKAGAKAACVISERGEFKGMISRKGLIETTRRYEEASDEGLDETLGDDDEEQSLVVPA
ncbi:clcC [Symbiodinium natans]|uniref:ClcC protein n=1 Tax=Symbiodinium natans TaxID=878477 RepID=A0A812GGV8_9DINO|nr:clcC [Symbiodinium natans]